jgi:MATE family multidrug resistance protein
MAFSAAAFVLVPGPLARVLTDRPEVIVEAVALVQVAAVFQLFDGLQVVGAGALRGIGETRSTLIANVIGHFVIGLPLAIVLTFYAGFGATGLWWGLSAGLITVGVALSVRFFVIARGELKRS